MKLYTIKKLEALLGRSPGRIREWIREGCPTPGGPVRLDAVKLGRTWTVSEEDLLLFRHRVAQKTAADRPRLSDEAGTTAPPGPGKRKGKSS